MLDKKLVRKIEMHENLKDVLLDVPSNDLLFGFEELKNAVVNLFADRKPQFTVGILGEWGAGKTTLSNSIYQDIKSRTEKNINKNTLNTLQVPVWFDAWRYEHEDNIIIPLFFQIRKALLETLRSLPDSKDIDGFKEKFDKIITVDPKFKNFLNYKNVTVFKPNIKETEEALAIKITTNQDLIRAGEALMEKLKAKGVLITRGSQGMSLFEEDSQITHVETRTRKVADVSGAGDTVISTLTAALADGSTLQEAATIANYAAGIVCEYVGIVPVENEKLYRACLGQDS